MDWLWRLTGAHQAALSLPLLNSTGWENSDQKLVGQDKDTEITYQLPSQVKLTQDGEISFIYCQLIAE